MGELADTKGEYMTIEERLDKLDRWCATLESHLVILGKKLDGVRCIPVIDLPEKFKKDLKIKSYVAGHEYCLHREVEKTKDEE